MRRAARLVIILLVLGSCDSARIDPLEEFASASCAAVQSWVDAVEDYGTELSRAVTQLERASERRPRYGEFARAVHERTDDTVRQLRHIAPAHGDGRVAADMFIAAMLASEDVATELVGIADSLPTGDDDPEDVASRVASLFVANEKAFSHATRALDELAERYEAFARAPSCVDYDDPVT